MANSFVRYTGNASTVAFSIPFTFINSADLTCTVAGASTTFTLNDAKTTATLSSAPASGAAIEFRRRSSQATRLTDYVAGAVLKEDDLDTDSIQAFNMAQEAIDDAGDVIKLDASNFQWDGQSKRLTTIADPVNDQDVVTKAYLSTNLPNITTVAGIASNVTTVAGIASNVTAVAADATDIGTVATNIASVNTVAGDITKVVAVANDLAEAVSEIETVANDLNEATSEIDTVSNNITNVNTVGTGIANVNTVAGISANVSTVAGISANVTSVAGISSAVSAVNSNATNINAVNSNSSNINTVAGISADVTAVSSISSDVAAVENIAANVTTVAGISSNVTTVAGDATEIAAVAGNATNINTVAGANSNINTVAGAITNINTTATNIAGVNSFAERYRVGSSDPTSNNDAGDLAFNTTSNTLKFFDGSSYNAITSGIADNEVTTAKINADAVTGAKIADDAINSEHYTDGSIDTAHIADAQVTTAKIADNAITNGKMADDSVGAAELVDNSVGAAALNISGNGTTGQVIVSDGDGSFSYADTSNPFSPTTASGTSPTLSLATHNFFDLGQLSGNTTLAFSNIPTAKRWFVDVQGNGSQSNFASGTRVGQSNNYTGASYANLRGTNGVCYKPDGSVVFICGGLNTSTYKQHIKSYALSTAFDPSSISLSDSPTKVFDLSSQVYSASQGDQYVTGLDMRSDGTMFYINHYDPAGGENKISQYTMSTPFDVSSASHTATKSVYGSGYNPSGGKTRGLHLRQNGADIYFANDQDNRIERWTMSTPYSISSASQTSTFDISGTTTTPNNVVLTEDGTKMIVTANLFTLSSAFDITSAGSPSSLGEIIDGHLGDMSITNSDKHLSQITLGASAVTSTGVTIYSTAFITPFTLTMPAAVKNSDYLPDVNVDDQYLLEFNTTDGGTNIWKTAHVKYDDN